MKRFSLVHLLVLLAVVTAGSFAVDLRAVWAATPFPLRVSENGRYLVDREGNPFFINGDTPWSLTHNLTEDGAEAYMRDRVSKGINALIVSAPDAYAPDGSRTYPPDQKGRHPFLDDDITRPDPGYWANVERVLKKAEELNLLILFFPAYLGCCDDGYLQFFVDSGEEKARAYGRWIGDRLKVRQNLIWVHGGDRKVDGAEAVVRAIAEGIREADPGKLHTVHWAPETDPWAPFGEDFVDIYSAYTYGPVAARVQACYRHLPVKPVILIESDYENDFNHRTAEDVRKFPYRAVLSGAAGHFFGNRPLWFCGTGWEKALNLPGSQYMEIAGKFWRSKPWHLLVPDLEGKLVAPGEAPFTTDAGVQAALTADGRMGIAFLPVGGKLRVDLDALQGEAIRATWFQPSSGKELDAGTHPGGTEVTFEAKTTSDWVLVLDSK